MDTGFTERPADRLSGRGILRASEQLVVFRELQRHHRIAAVLVAVVACGIACSDAARASAQISSWAVGDWLINYNGGFVRRGLVGQLVVWTDRATGIPAQWLVWVVKASLYVTIYGSAVWILLKARGLTIAHALILLSPAVLLFEAQNELLAGRKELFLLAWVAVLSLRKAAGRWNEASYAHLAIGWTLLAAIHEGLLFFWPHFIAFLYMLNPRNAYSPVRLLLTAAPAAVVFAAGLPAISPADPQAICEALQDSAPRNCAARGAIGLLNAGMDSAVSRVLSELTPGGIVNVLAALVLSFGLILWIARHDRLMVPFSPGKKRELAFFFVLGVVSVAALASVSVDWGRWIHISATLLGFGAVAFAAAPSTAAAAADADLRPDRRRFTALASRYAVAAAYAFAGAYLLLWKLPYCCVRGASMSWVRTSLEFLRDALR